MKEFIKIHPKDNVAVALVHLTMGTELTIDNKKLQIKEDIPGGHKFALSSLNSGEEVIKYGYSIGKVTEEVEEGNLLHTHNIKTNLSDIISYEYNPAPSDKTEQKKYFFEGFLRKNEKVGIRNEIWIIPTVGCVNSIALALEKKGNEYVEGGVDEVIAFTHPYGCSQMGDDQENTRTILADLILHPNAGGVLVLGLGCENSSIATLKEYLGEYDTERIRFLQCQDTEDEVEDGIQIIRELIQVMKEDKRELVSAKHLVVGLKCGGSDGYSGITANPLVGAFSDELIKAGGTTILTEVPEMFGAETILMNRCQNEELFHKTVNMVNGFKDYFKRHDQTIYENPSPGNKAGGISTLEDKSLGCTQKAGSSTVCDVLDYGERVKKNGLNLLAGPGNDLIAATALAAAGAQLVLFTTGRGTPFASPVPTLKLASNHALMEKKKNWIDFDCGRLLYDHSMEELTDELVQLVLEVASGKKVKSEVAGYHDLAIFKQGVTL